MNILYTSDNKFCNQGMVSIRSVLENNRKVDEINFFYVANNITENNKEAVRNLVKTYGRNIEFIDMPSLDEFKKGNEIQTNIVLYSYCFLHEILPDSIEKILLIECDTLVMQSLLELWDTDITNYYIAAVDDVKSKYYKRVLEMRESSCYFNSGVFLANLKKWRDDNISEKMKQTIWKRNGKIFYEVQDEMNIVFESQVLILPPKYNSTTSLFLFDYKNMIRYRKPVSCFTENEFKEAKKNPVILHFTRNHIIQSRPWIEKCEHPFKNQYLQVKEQAVFLEEPLWKLNNKIGNRLAHLFYKIFPQTVTATLLGVVQAWLYPLKIKYTCKGE